MAEKMEVKTIEVETITGKLVVKISDEECTKFGFRHGDRVITNFKQEAIIMGVAPALRGSRVAGQDVLWFAINGITYYYGPGDLRELGFMLKTDNPKKEEEVAK